MICYSDKGGEVKISANVADVIYGSSLKCRNMRKCMLFTSRASLGSKVNVRCLNSPRGPPCGPRPWRRRRAPTWARRWSRCGSPEGREPSARTRRRPCSPEARISLNLIVAVLQLKQGGPKGFTPDMKVLYMLLERCHTEKNRKRYLKQRIKFFNFRSKI